MKTVSNCKHELADKNQLSRTQHKKKETNKTCITWHFGYDSTLSLKTSSPRMLLDHTSMDRTTLEKSLSSTKLLMKQHSQRYEALDSDNSGFEPAASSSNSTAIRSSTVSFTSDSRMTGGSGTLAARILRSSSNDTGLQDLSNRGLLDMMRKRCSRRVCSRPFQWSHKLCSPRPAILKSTRHRRHLANPSTTRLFRGKPTKVPTTPETKNDGFNVLIARFRPANTQHISHSTTVQSKPLKKKRVCP